MIARVAPGEIPRRSSFEFCENGVSSLAIQIAQTHNLTLVGYARDQRLTIYAHGERFRGNAAAIYDLLRENG